MYNIKELRCVYAHMYSKDPRREDLAFKYLKVQKRLGVNLNRIEIIFNTFKIENNLTK